MKISELIQDSAQFHPNGGWRMPPAACAFILAELEALVNKYHKKLCDENLSPTLRSMVVHHLEGLEYIEQEVRKGMTNKPE